MLLFRAAALLLHRIRIFIIHAVSKKSRVSIRNDRELSLIYRLSIISACVYHVSINNTVNDQRRVVIHIQCNQERPFHYYYYVFMKTRKFSPNRSTREGIKKPANRLGRIPEPVSQIIGLYF